MEKVQKQTISLQEFRAKLASGEWHDFRYEGIHKRDILFNGDGTFSIYDKNGGWQLTSLKNPEIYVEGNTISLRGTNSSGSLVTYSFSKKPPREFVIKTNPRLNGYTFVLDDISVQVFNKGNDLVGRAYTQEELDSLLCKRFVLTNTVFRGTNKADVIRQIEAELKEENENT